MDDDISTIGLARTILRIAADSFCRLEDYTLVIGYDAKLVIHEANVAMEDVLRYARHEHADTGRAIRSGIQRMEDTNRTIRLGHRNDLGVDRQQVLGSVLTLGCMAQTVGHVCGMHLPSVSSRLISLQTATEREGNVGVGRALSVLLDPTEVASGLSGVR